MARSYVHGYDPRESIRLQDQASTLAELLHSDTAYPAGSRVLEAGCGVGAQTVSLARNSPDAFITAVDVAADSLAEAKARVEAEGCVNASFRQADIFALPFGPDSFDHIFVCFVLEHLSRPVEALQALGRVLRAGGTITATRPRSQAGLATGNRPALPNRTGNLTALVGQAGGRAAH